MARRIVGLITAVLGAFLAVSSVEDKRLQWSALAAFVVLAIGFLILEQISDNQRAKVEAAFRIENDRLHARTRELIAEDSVPSKREIAQQLYALAQEELDFAASGPHQRGEFARGYRSRLESPIELLRREHGFVMPRVYEVSCATREEFEFVAKHLKEAADQLSRP